jgi:hypothetical protein
VLWWLVVIAIPLIETIYWVWVTRLPPLTRIFAVPRLVPTSLLHLFLLVFALSQVGGFVGAAFAAIPQAPAWFYALIILFLLFEIVIFTIWALRHFMPRVTRPTWPNTSRRHSASTTIPLPQNKP